MADPTLQWLDDELVAGGSPWRLVRLTALGRARLVSWLGGAPLDSDDRGRALARRLVDAGMLHPCYPARTPHDGEVVAVVPCRDDPEGLGTALAHLAADGVEVTVVDDGSVRRDEVDRVARAHGASLVRRERPGGAGAARNAGLAATASPLVAFVDAGVRTEPGWLARLLPYFDDPAVAAVAPRVRGPGGSTARDRFEAVASPLDLGPTPAVVRPGGVVPFVPSAALVARRDALGGGFDESLRTGEDVDLVWRLVEAGWQVRYDPCVEASHDARDSWGAWVAQRVAYGGSAASLESRHGDKAAPLRADPRILAAVVLAVVGRPRAAAGLVSWLAASLERELRRAGHAQQTRDAARQLAARGTALAAPGLARSAFRTYGPALVAGAILWRRARRPVLALAVASTAVRWWRSGRPRSVGFAALSVADDLAYGTGVVAGAIGARRLGALRPRLGPWLRRQEGLRRT